MTNEKSRPVRPSKCAPHFPSACRQRTCHRHHRTFVPRRRTAIITAPVRQSCFVCLPRYIHSFSPLLSPPVQKRDGSNARPMGSLQTQTDARRHNDVRSTQAGVGIPCKKRIKGEPPNPRRHNWRQHRQVRKGGFV
ncbi:hypothetical protein MRX96_007943 [Rhipicephalus microplus]